MEDEALGFRLVDALDRCSRVPVLGIAPARQDHGDRRLVGDFGAGRADISRGRCRECLQEVTFDPRQDRLCLGVAEAAIELEHLRPLLRQHQPGVQESYERDAASRKLGEHRKMHGREQVVGVLGTQLGHRRVGPHPARIRAGVALPDALVIARRCQCDRIAAVGHREERHLLAL
jgi:hypothetical protein